MAKHFAESAGMNSAINAKNWQVKAFFSHILKLASSLQLCNAHSH
jgi:hypothetical protein